MHKRIALAGCLAAAGLVALPALAQTPPEGQAPGGATPEKLAKARELGMKGQALFTMLKDPSRCGAPDALPKGFACALVLYKDVSEDRKHDRLPELLTTRATGMSDTQGLPREAKVRVLSPFDASPRTVSPLAMPVLHMSISGSKSGAEIAVLEMQAVLGYAENEALAKGDPRKVDRDRFKLPRAKLN